MGRAFSKKPVSDIETAAETVIPDSLSGSILRKTAECNKKLSPTAGMQVDRPFDAEIEKRTNSKK